MVTGIALFELLRAGLFVLVALSPLRGYRLDPVPFTTVQVLTLDANFYILHENEVPSYLRRERNQENEKLDVADAIILGGPMAVWTAYTGIALLLWKKAGRSNAFAHSAVILLCWGRGLLFNLAWQHTSLGLFTSPQTRSSIMLALLLNGIIFLYMLYGNNVAHAFGEKE